MPSPIVGVPINALQKRINEVIEATPALFDFLAGATIDDKVFDQLVPPSNGAGGVRPMPYACWASATNTPGSGGPIGGGTTVFGQGGSASTLYFHLFTPRPFSKSDAMAFADQLTRAVSGQSQALEGGFKLLLCTVNMTSSFPVAGGQQTIFLISTATRTVA